MSNQNKKTNRLRFAAAVVTALATATVLSSGQIASAASAKPAEIRIAYQAIPNGDLVVKHSRWLEKAFPGSKITWTEFQSGGDVNTAVIAGAVDIGLAGSSPVTRGLSAPLNIGYSVPWIHDVIGTAESLVVQKSSGITTVAGLKGKKIGVPFASTAHYSLLAALKEAGVASSDVTLVDLQPTDILAAWQRGDISAAYVWSPTLDLLKQNGTVLATSAQLAKKGYPTYDLAVVTNAFRSKYPAAVQTWLKAQNRAVTLIQKSPAAAAKLVAPELGISAAEVTEQFKGLVFLNAKQQQSAEFLGVPSKPGAFAAGLLKAAEFLKGQAKIDAVPSLSTLTAGVDNKDLYAAFKK